MPASSSVSEHRRASPAGVACFVLSISDTRTRATDTSGQLIADLARADGHTIVDHQLVKDDPPAILEVVRAALEGDAAQAIITTGGTGVSRRDSTFEALSGLFEKELVGFGELFRMLSFQEIGSAAMLSRATAGTRSNRVIFVLPGSEHAVRLAMTRLILPELAHVIRELNK